MQHWQENYSYKETLQMIEKSPLPSKFYNAIWEIKVCNWNYKVNLKISTVNYYLLKKITTAVETSALNFSPFAEEAEASSDELIPSNICKIQKLKTTKNPQTNKNTHTQKENWTTNKQDPTVQPTVKFILQSKLSRSTMLFQL